MLRIQTGKITFPSRKGFGPQFSDETKSFPQNIQNFTVGLTGFEIKYDKEDEHVLRINVHVEGSLVGPTTVEVKCTLALRDSSGDWDNPYTGYVAYAIVAVMEEAPTPPTEKLAGFVHSLKTIHLATTRGLLVQLYVPIDEKLIDLTLDLSNTDPSVLVLTALLRDALALSLPVSCEAVPSGDPETEQYTLTNVEIKTRKTYHQAAWKVSDGEFKKIEKEIGTVHGKVTLVSVRAFGLLKETDDDLPDVAHVFVTDAEEQETELFLGLQRADLDTNLSMLSMLLEAYRKDGEVIVGYYREPLYHGDAVPVKWIQYIQFGRVTG